MTRRFGWIALVLVWVGTAHAQVMDQVPADAVLMLKVGNLKSANEKFGDLMQQLGVARLSPDWADPVGGLEKLMGIHGGVKADGDCAVALFDLDMIDEGGMDLLVLVPVTDYAEFLKNFADTKKDGELDVVHTAVFEGIYVAHWGQYAALSAKKKILKKAGGFKLPPETAKFLADPNIDVSLIANIQAMRDKELFEIQAERQDAQDDAIAAFRTSNGLVEFEPLIKALMSRLFDLSEGSLIDGRASALGFTISKDGIKATLVHEFDPQSPAGRHIAALKNCDDDLLAGLPDGPYVAFGGAKIDPQSLTKIINDVFDPVVKTIPRNSENGKLLLQGINAWKKTLALTQQEQAAVLLNAEANATGMLRVISIAGGDSKSIFAAQENLQPSLQNLWKLTPAPPMKFTNKQKAKTLDGVDFSMVKQEMKADAQNPDEVANQQAYNSIFGPGGRQSFTGVVDEKHVLTMTGDDDDLTKAAIASIRTQDNPLARSDVVSDVAEQLPKQRFAVVYIQVDRAITSGVKIRNLTQHENIRIQLPPNLPPVGITFGSSGPALRVDAYVSSQLIQSISAAVIQMELEGMNKP